VIADFVAIKLGDLDGTYVPTAGQFQEDGQLANLSNLNLGTDQQLKSGLTLEQNQPNPFHDETLINFSLPEAGPITLTVWDLQGKLIHKQSAVLAEGSHQISLDVQDLGNVKGMFYYTLQTANGRETKKMLRF